MDPDAALEVLLEVKGRDTNLLVMACGKLTRIGSDKNPVLSAELRDGLIDVRTRRSRDLLDPARIDIIGWVDDDDTPGGGNYT